MSLKADCLHLIKIAIDSINPQKLVKTNLKLLNENRLVVNNKYEFQLNKNVYIAAFGKAVSGMCTEVENIVREHFVKGIAIVPSGSLNNTIPPYNTSKIKFFQGAHNNIPDLAAYEAAKDLYSMCSNLTQEDILIACISGGGSALLPLPVDSITLDEKIKTTKLVASAGASINELNTIRMCLSKVKGGGLARASYPAKVVSLIISDVIDDPLDIIASGPTFTSDNDGLNRYKTALNIIEKYKLNDRLPSSVTKYLSLAADKHSSDQNSIDNEIKNKNLVYNFLIGNNKLATEAMQNDALKLSYKPSLILSNSLEGEAKICAKMFANLAFVAVNYKFYAQNLSLFESEIHNGFDENQITLFNRFLSVVLSQIEENLDSHTDKLCILCGGETTVSLLNSIQDNCLGGRNQEMALAFKKEYVDLYNHFKCISNDVLFGEFAFTSFGTDGIDGPTDAAGAIITNDNASTILNNNEDYEIATKALKNHDSYHYFEKIKDLIKTGHTGTNVADCQVLLVKIKNSS